jgi:LemA protein
MTAALVVVAVVAVVLAVSAVVYKELVRQRNQVDSAWSQLDVQRPVRYDLISRLVETVKGYAGHEQGTLDAVAEARARALTAQSPAELASAEHALTGALKRLFVVVESYPDLRASPDFLELQRDLSAAEDRAAYARQYYNDAVLTYNNAVTSMPQRLLAAVLKLRVREYFQAGGKEPGPVEVQF